MIWATELPPSLVPFTTTTIGCCGGADPAGGGVLHDAPSPQVASCFVDEGPKKENANTNKTTPIPTRELPTANRADR
jgi:hypothetical protein